jgi:chromosome segregation ATPase
LARREHGDGQQRQQQSTRQSFASSIVLSFSFVSDAKSLIREEHMSYSSRVEKLMGGCEMDEELALLQDQLNEAQAEVERLQLAAADAEARASTLDEQNRDLRFRLDSTETDLASVRQESQDLQSRLQTAAAKYREALLASAPDLPQDIISGETVEELDASVEKARQTVRQVREHLESQAQSGRVPAGAPPRSAPDFSSLSPVEKIRLGLNRD